MKCERHPWHSIYPGQETPQFVRSIIEAKVIGAMEMIDGNEHDDKIIRSH